MRLYYGGYGHHPSGKQFVYWGGDNYRTGQSVVAPVTNKWTHRTHNTMFTIMRTSGGGSEMATNEAQRLSMRGIGIKYLNGTDVLQLPGAIENGYRSKRQWRVESDQKYLDRISGRVMSYYPAADTSSAEQRLMGE